MNRSAVIVGTGRYLSEGVFTIDDVLGRMGYDPANLPNEKIRKSVEKAYRIRRKIVDLNTSTSTLFVEAGKRALAKAGIGPEDVSLLICVTDTPDYISPATSARVHHGLGTVNAGFFDLNSACAGFSIALTVASNYLRCTEEARHVLIIGGNVYTKHLDPADLDDQLLFSDGAGAVVLAASDREDRGILKSTMVGKGEYWNYWGIYGGGTWKAFSPEAMKEGFHFLKKVTPYERDINLKNWPPVIRQTLEKTGWKASDVDLAFVTQSRKRTIPEVCDILGWKHEVSYNTADEYGYLGSACIPVALDDAVEKGALKAGQKILILTSGVGYSCCSVSLIWGR